MVGALDHRPPGSVAMTGASLCSGRPVPRAYVCAVLVLAGSTAVLLRRTSFGTAAVVDLSQYMNEPIRYGAIATLFWGVVRFLVGGSRAATRLSRPQHRAVVQFRSDAPAVHLSGDLRLRRQCADRHIFLRSPEDDAGAGWLRGQDMALACSGTIRDASSNCAHEKDNEINNVSPSSGLTKTCS